MMQVASKGSAMDADAYGNSGDVEATWAMQAMDHAECHMSLLLSGVSWWEGETWILSNSLITIV